MVTFNNDDKDTDRVLKKTADGREAQMGGTNNDVYLIVLLVIWAIATLYAYIFDMDKNLQARIKDYKEQKTILIPK